MTLATTGFLHHHHVLKEHVALDRTSWSIKSACNHFLIKCIWLERCFKSRTQWSTQICLKIAWFSFRTVKGKTPNFEANLCRSLYSTFKTSFKPYAFLANGYKRFSKTNSTDPRQRVPLKAVDTIGNCISIKTYLVTGNEERFIV